MKAPNGPLLPDTAGEQWHFIENVTYEKGRLTLIHNYESDAISIAMRPPFTPEYLTSYTDSLRGREHVIVHDIGITPEGRPLQVIQVGGEDEKSLREKPCLLIYAREHADEHDGSWVVQGAIEYLLLEETAGARIRNFLTLLVIPIYDPDGAAQSTYHRIVDGFGPNIRIPECDQYMKFFMNWLNQGNRVDLVIDLHNVESSEAPHLSFGSYPKRSETMSKAMQYLHTLIQAQMESFGFKSPKSSWGGDNYFLRMTSIFQYQFSAPWILYEVNSQAPQRHLTTAELRIMGAIMVETISKYLRSREFRPLSITATKKREERLRRWLYWNPELHLENEFFGPYDMERAIWVSGDPEKHRTSKRYPLYRDLLKTKFPQFVPKESLSTTSRKKD